MKKSVVFASLALVAVLSTGCEFNFSVGGSGDTAKVQDMFVDLICMTSDTMASISNTNFDGMTGEELAAASTAMQAKSDQMKKDMDALPAKYGFKDDAAVSAAFKNVSDQAAFKKDVTAKATAKCNAKSDIIDGILNAK